MNLGEGGARFGAQACSLLPALPGDPLNPFLPGSLVTFGLTTTFHRAGTHTITVTVANGGCGGDQSTTQTFTVNVGGTHDAGAARPAAGWRPAPRRRPPAATISTVPDAGNAAVVAAAAVCLVNGERVSAGPAGTRGRRAPRDVRDARTPAR